MATAGWSMIVYSADSSPLTQASLGIHWIQDSRLQPFLANDRHAHFAPYAGSVTMLSATVPWPPFSNNSNQCQSLPSIHLRSIALLDTQRHYSRLVWHGTRESAIGQPAHIVMSVRHARHHIKPETAQIPPTDSVYKLAVTRTPFGLHTRSPVARR